MQSFHELDLVPGQTIRIDTSKFTGAKNPREKFRIIEAPAHGIMGRVIAIGMLGQAKITFTTNEPIIVEVIND